MPSNISILEIGSSSDGTGANPAKTTLLVQNDAHFLEKLAERWAKDQGIAVPGMTFMLEQLPAGYGGYEKTRSGDTKHVDRYLYGHPNGIFRSINEAYPHFKHLQDNGGPAGCSCKLCVGGGRSKRGPKTNASSTPRARPSETRFVPLAPSALWKKPQTDDEGGSDIYLALLNRLKDDKRSEVGVQITDTMSPDWRTGNEMLLSVMNEWSQLPNYVPRVGELVLFARNVSSVTSLAWDPKAASLRCVDPASAAWLERPRWEAGVVTQMPVEPLTPQDLSGASSKLQSVTYSGFRIEPLSEPNSKSKPHSQQRKYVPLHLIRPLWFWKECLNGVEQIDWHPTVKHALTVASSVCVIGKYEFKGKWPEATAFGKGVFLGPELIMVGDAVRITPGPADSQTHAVTDIMIVSSIRVRFANLKEAYHHDRDEPTYNTCLHICGRPYTIDPKRSFDGVGKKPAKAGSDAIPAPLMKYGPWYSTIDPGQPKLRLELPYTRIFGRCYDHAAMTAWFPTNDIPPPSSFKAVNTNAPDSTVQVGDISQGLMGMYAARTYSQHTDKRIDRVGGKRWFWAETRIEQLDLHEVNGHYVGAKDESRNPSQMNAWRQALKVLDGKKGAVDAYQASRTQRQEEQKQIESQAVSDAWGMMASAQLGVESED